MKPVTAGIFLALWCHRSIVLGKFCPNQHDKCPAVMTCCLLLDDTYGCCPYQDAQCCSDRIHCCPSGTKCNVSLQSCDSLSANFPYRWMASVYPKNLVTKNYANSKLEESIEDLPQDRLKCPDGNTCAADATCCQMPTRNFGCCLYSNATCCSDREHCCPEGYMCDLSHDRCKLAKTDQLPGSILNVPLFNLNTGAYEVMLPPLDCDPECDPESSAIACRSAGLRSRRPSATACGEGREDCKEGNDLDRLFLKSSDPIEHFDVICPDKTTACPPASTCCESSSGDYGCCPMAEATCCPDQKHCCPNGYVCDESDCERKPSLSFKDAISTPWNRAFGPVP